MFSAKDFKERRTQLLNLIKEPIAMAVIYGRELLMRSPTIPIEFNQYSDLVYFTGYTRPSGTLVMLKNYNVEKSVLFLPENDYCENYINSFEDTKKLSGVDAIRPIAELNDFLKKNASGSQVYCSFPPHQSGFSPFKQLSFLTDQLRVVKSPKEIELIKKACEITTKSLSAALSKAKPGIIERDIEAEFILQNAKQGASRVAYPTVVASGSNALCLHYLDNNKQICDGDVVMMDAGCEYQNYASDFTRSICVGKVPELHKAVLEMVNWTKEFLVLNAKAHKFQSLEHIHVMSEQLLINGLKELGMNVNQQQIRSLYPHGCSHWIGLDVHDADSIPYNYQLRKGNVFSIEPGLYFDPLNPIVPKEFAGLGCRFEDTVILE
jgi:Xaa-Pro aminopeptidase